MITVTRITSEWKNNSLEDARSDNSFLFEGLIVVSWKLEKVIYSVTFSYSPWKLKPYLPSWHSYVIARYPNPCEWLLVNWGPFNSKVELFYWNSRLKDDMKRLGFSRKDPGANQSDTDVQNIVDLENNKKSKKVEVKEITEEDKIKNEVKQMIKAMRDDYWLRGWNTTRVVELINDVYKHFWNFPRKRNELLDEIVQWYGEICTLTAEREANDEAAGEDL